MTTTMTNEFRLIGNSIKAAVSDMKNNSEFDGQKFTERLSELMNLSSAKDRGLSTLLQRM